MDQRLDADVTKAFIADLKHSSDGKQPPHSQPQDIEGLRVRTMGVDGDGDSHAEKKRHHHHRHKHSRPNNQESDDEDRPITPPAELVRKILGEDANANAHHEVHPIFSEMEVLYMDDDFIEWREQARWIKFEEDVEEGGVRWSKPHVASLSLHALFELRSMLLNGAVVLDLDASTLDQVADHVLDHLPALTPAARDKVRVILLQRHRHLYERGKEATMCRLPRPERHSTRRSSSSKRTPAGGDGLEYRRNSVYKSKHQIIKHKGNMDFMRKIPAGAEASNILVGEVDFLDRPVSAFVRLKKATLFGDLTEVPVPTRFIFILLAPTGGAGTDVHAVGRAMGTLMADEVFAAVAYRAHAPKHLLAAADEFMGSATVLPPGEWDPDIRIEPPDAVPSQEPRKRPEVMLEYVDPEIQEQKMREESGLTRSGRLFGGLINDLKRKAPWYWSDFKDALAMQCVASWIFLYFACLSPIITFGGLLSEATGRNMAAMESLVSGFACGVIYGLFSGQPLAILGSTGPVLVFEAIIYDVSISMGLDYMTFRLWIGLWMAFILFVMVATDAGSFVCYITRFTEENFATLIALIFVYKAVENVLKLGKRFPLDTHHPPLGPCACQLSPLLPPVDGLNWTTLDPHSCQSLNGSMVGDGCDLANHVPDVFLMSVILFFGTFTISIILKDFKNSLFFPTKVRQFLSDFAVIIAIVIMSFIDYTANIPTPKLEVPSEFKPTLAERGWLIPFMTNPVWTIPLALLPAILGTILIFMDQQITVVIVNRKDNKLKKGCGYHLDLFVLSILIAMCSVLGLPWFVASTVQSINHVDSLKIESECAAPGDKPKFLGVREQRVTHILIFLMIGLSVMITPILSHIPMPVLFGVFLYMGVASLKGLQFFDRILLMFMPTKYQPDFAFLRKVPIRRVHLFTLIQLVCFILLWLINSYNQTSILFPIMLVVLVGIRKCLDLIFTQRELKALDDLMPSSKKRQHHANDAESGFKEDNLKIPLTNGNLKIVIKPMNASGEVAKTTIWKGANNGLNSSLNARKMTPFDDPSTVEERTRLAPMAEAEDNERNGALPPQQPPPPPPTLKKHNT